MEFIGFTETKQLYGSASKPEPEEKEVSHDTPPKTAQTVNTKQKGDTNKANVSKRPPTLAKESSTVSDKSVKLREEKKKPLKRTATKKRLKVFKRKDTQSVLGDTDTIENVESEDKEPEEIKEQEKCSNNDDEDEKKDEVVEIPSSPMETDRETVQIPPQLQGPSVIEVTITSGVSKTPKDAVETVSSEIPPQQKSPLKTPPPSPEITPTPAEINETRQFSPVSMTSQHPGTPVIPIILVNSRRASMVSETEGVSRSATPTPVTINSRPFVTRLLTNPNMQVASEPSSGSALWMRAVSKAKALTMFQSVSEAKPEEKIVYKYYKGRRISVNPVTGKRRSMAELQKHVQKVNAKRRFRRWGKLIIFCKRCIEQHSYTKWEEKELNLYIRVLMYMDYRRDAVPDLMFDPTQFRANRKMRISEETKKILSKRGSDRTEHEVYSCQIALRNIKNFVEFPARMQRKIAEVGMYESYQARRVIIREGHPPAAFYFILSGSVVAMALDKTHTSASPIGEYVKGDSFEEQPMLHDTPRQSTVLTKEPCELLSISNKDYKTIFMQGGVKNINDPDQETFLKNLSFLDGWPIPLLLDHPKKCQFIYFKRGTVVARNTHHNDWIVIVKSGSISVLKKLKKVGPNEWSRKNVMKPLTERQKRERVEQRYQWRRFVLPELKLPLRKTCDVEEVEERIDGKPKPFQHPELKFKFDEDEEKGNHKRKSKYFYPNLWTYSNKKGGDEATSGKQETNFSNINKQYLYLMSGNKLPTSETRLNTNTTPLTRSRTLDSQQFAKALSPDLISRGSYTSSPDPMAYGLKDTRSDSSQSLWGRDKYSSLADGSGIRSKSEGTTPGVDANPEFVKVQTLVKGQVWGLADLILQDQPSFTVVSNGADLVLLNKQFYEDHSSERLQRKMREELCPYPSDDDLQQGLQVSVNWQEYRKRNLTSTLQILPRRPRILNIEQDIAT